MFFLGGRWGEEGVAVVLNLTKETQEPSVPVTGMECTISIGVQIMSPLFLKSNYAWLQLPLRLLLLPWIIPGTADPERRPVSLHT